jgi:DNA processing protein
MKGLDATARGNPSDAHNPLLPIIDQGDDPSARKKCAGQTQAFLTLAAIRGIGHKTLFDLAEGDHSFTDLLELGPSEALPFVRRSPGKGDATSPVWTAVRAEAAERAARMADLLQAMDVRLIFRDDPNFPPALLDLERPPRWLFIQGSLSVLRMPSVAIVGTREPSQDGLSLARYVGACLSDWPGGTVSGLAAGIDQLAHESSLRAEVRTIAVLGTGILDNYPKGPHLLRERILGAGGTIISEYLPRASYSAENFVQRNRLQAALGRVLIPVEWARRGGTAHTVRFATELQRPIACLRLADWPSDRVMLEPGPGSESGKIFTVPREQDAFDRFVRAALDDTPPPALRQLSLFDEG